ncbi:hypothetical protein L0244_35760 [bacterium]|nr:hypothetical protein [bacterium]
MNQIKPDKYSAEWFELATTDELILSITEAKHFLETTPGITQHQRLLWEERIKKISEELDQRKTSGDEWQEP